MLEAKNINKRFDDDGHDDDDEMNDAFAWACHHMCFSLCQSMNALLRQGCHQKQKYIIANITTRSTNISSPILSVLLNGKPASNCMNLVPAVQHISGSQLFKLNQKLALIMNLLAL